MSQRYKTADCTNYQLLKQFAYKNRGNPTEAESMLWQYLKDKQFGFRFRRQHIIGDYIADFVCIKKNLIIEVDGEYHSVGEQPELDRQRTEWLHRQGYTVIRFTNEEVFNDIERIIREIRTELS